jgi:hypothetical protein
MPDFTFNHITGVSPENSTSPGPFKQEVSSTSMVVPIYNEVIFDDGHYYGFGKEESFNTSRLGTSTPSSLTTNPFTYVRG